MIIPTYGRAETLGRALGSVLGQSFKDFEVIVVDDCSPETPHVFKDARVRLMRRASNGGAGAARNTGLEAARGRWIAFLDDDDYLYPEWLSAVAAASVAHEDWDIVTTDADLSGGGCLYDTIEFHHGPDQLAAMLDRPFLSVMSAIRAPMLGSIRFAESLGFREDYQLWLQLFHAGARAGLVQRPLARIEAGGKSSQSIKPLEAVIEMLHDVLRWDLSPNQRRAAQRHLIRALDDLAVARARIAIQDGSVARKDLWAAVRAQTAPLSVRTRALLAIVAPRLVSNLMRR